MNLFKMRYFFLMILVISLAFHSPINNTAFAADTTNGSIITEVASLEYYTADASDNSLIQVDSDTYALAYTDVATNDGFIDTFTVDADGAITEVAGSGFDALNLVSTSPFEHNTGDGTHHSFVKVDDDTFVLAYASTALMGKISTNTISADGLSIKGNIVKYEHETVKASYNSIVQVDSDTYALAYTGGDDDGHIQTFTIDEDGLAITKVTNLEHNTSDGTHNSLVKVDDDTFALAYASTSNMGKIATFTISADGATITELVDLEHDTTQATYNSLVKVDSDTYALAYAGDGDDGFIKTFTITSDGSSSAAGGSTITEIESLEHDTTQATYNSFVKVDDDTYALAYAGDGDDGFIKTFTISADGATITEVASLEHDTTQATHNSLISAPHGILLAYTGADDDGFLQTFSITGTASSSSSGGGSNSCDSNGIWGTSNSLRVYEVSYNAESYQVQVQAYSTCGGISAIMTASGQQNILSLSTDQPLLDQNIAIYSGYLDQSDESFRIMLENDRHSFDKIFYVQGESLNEKYTGTTGYTSEQQGMPVQVEVLPESNDGIYQITEQELYNEPELLLVASEVLPADPEPFEPEPLELEPPELTASALSFDFIWNIFNSIFS